MWIQTAEKRNILRSGFPKADGRRVNFNLKSPVYEVLMYRRAFRETHEFRFYFSRRAIALCFSAEYTKRCEIRAYFAARPVGTQENENRFRTFVFFIYLGHFP